MKEQYNQLKQKYSLPDYNCLDKEFEISTIESEFFILRDIIEKILERLDFFSGILEKILQPDTSSLKSIQESTFFDDSDQKEILDIFKKLTIINRRSLEISLDRDEAKEAEYIGFSYKLWKEIKPKLRNHLKKLQDSWKSETNIKASLGYMG